MRANGFGQSQAKATGAWSQGLGLRVHSLPGPALT